MNGGYQLCRSKHFLLWSTVLVVLCHVEPAQFKGREAELRRRVMTDPHALPEYRTDTVRNLDSWYDLFQVEPGEKLYLAPNERVHIW